MLLDLVGKVNSHMIGEIGASLEGFLANRAIVYRFLEEAVQAAFGCIISVSFGDVFLQMFVLSKLPCAE